jgi:hypothetical protein
MSSATTRSGCWTCKARDSECDEAYPECKTCSDLRITCHYSESKPLWMDNGPLQTQMAWQLELQSLEVRNERRRLMYRRGMEAAAGQNQQDGQGDACVFSPTFTNSASRQAQSEGRAQHNSTASTNARQTSVLVSVSQTVRPTPRVLPGGFVSYYLDFFFPFLFPFYQPSMIEGGRTWLLEFMSEPDSMQKTAIALSSYLFSVVLDAADDGQAACKRIGRDKLFDEMRNAFKSLSNEMSMLSQIPAYAATRLSRFIRVLGISIHLQRFEIATQGFANSRVLLNFAIHYMIQMLDREVARSGLDMGACFFALMASLSPSPWPKPYDHFQIPSTEQVSLRFFLSLLVADDIIASTSFAEEPHLYAHHHSLLRGGPEQQAPVDLGAVIGCQNWVMLQIGEISALAAWKRRQTGMDGLALEVNRRANVIKETLNSRIQPAASFQNVTSTVDVTKEPQPFDVFHVWQSQPLTPITQGRVTTQIWAHAAMIYLLATVRGLDLNQIEIRQHVAEVIELINHKLAAPHLLRTVAWPFCVAGCLARPEQEAVFRRHAQALQPPALFVTAWKAVEIMELVWKKRETAAAEELLDSDMADCFRGTGEILYLI